MLFTLWAQTRCGIKICRAEFGFNAALMTIGLKLMRDAFRYLTTHYKTARCALKFPPS